MFTNILTITNNTVTLKRNYLQSNALRFHSFPVGIVSRKKSREVVEQREPNLSMSVFDNV